MQFNTVFSSMPTTVFEQMSRLAAEYKSINLGQGFPDTELEGPPSMKEVVSRSLLHESNQYPPLMGIPELRCAVADHSLRHTGLSVDSSNEVLITLGATEALASSFLGLLNPGDEAILFAPLYDSYAPMIRRAGATPVTVFLNPPQWSFNETDLAAAFSSKTKLIVVNTPHNPTGKVFTHCELECIAALCRQYPGVVAVLDEVYEHLVHPGSNTVFTTLRSLMDMEGRCIRIGSAGKTFSFTDFKIGWVTGPVAIINAVAKAHQYLSFTVNSALQRAVAHGLTHEQQFYTNLGAVLAEKREYMQRRLTEIGFMVLPAQGTYFLIADFAPLLLNNPRLRHHHHHPHSLDGSDVHMTDVEFCFLMTKAAGVTLIPVSAFYENSEKICEKTLVRFVFCKTQEKLTAACDALQQYFGQVLKT